MGMESDDQGFAETCQVFRGNAEGRADASLPADLP